MGSRWTGIRIHVDPAVTKTISSQFTGVELEQGLRQLLQLASLGYAILYAQGPTGGVTIKEVWVFPRRKEQEPFAKRDVEEREESETARRLREALESASQQMPPPTAEEQSETPRRLREALESARQQMPPPTEEKQSEAIRRFREAIEAHKQFAPGSRAEESSR